LSIRSWFAVPSQSPSYAATVAHRLTTFLLVATIATGVVLAGDALTGSPRDVTFKADARLDVKKVPEGVSPHNQESTAFAVDHPSARERRLALGADLLPIALLAGVLWFLRGVARSVRDGDPFTGENVRRLRAIGILLTGGVLAVHFAGAGLQDAIAGQYTSSPQQKFSEQGILPASPGDFPGVQLLSGLGAFVLAQVFAHGVALRGEVEATI